MLIYYLSLLDTQAEKDLLETIYYEYRTRMKRLALNMLRNDEDAEDAVQQAFLRLINALNRIDDPYSDETKAFLMIVQKYACLDLLRTKKKQITYDLDEILDQKYAQKIDLLENLTVEYIKKQIDRLINMINEDNKFKNVLNVLSKI